MLKLRTNQTKLDDRSITELLQKELKITGNLDAILQDDFIDYMTNKRYIFSQKKLTKDECQLIYWKIWQYNGWRPMNFAALIQFIADKKNTKTLELAQSLASDQQLRRQIQSKQSTPILFRELVKYGYTYGISFLEQSLKPLMDKDNLVDVTNIKLLFNSLSIKYNQQNIDDLRYYLADNGVIVLENYQQSKYLTSRIFINCQNLFQLIEQEA